MKKFLARYGECDVAVNGLEAVTTFSKAVEEENYYNLVCLDIRMPKLDGIGVFKAMRELEKQKGVNSIDQAEIIMTTAVNDRQIITDASDAGCNTFVWKPIEVERFTLALENLGLIE